MFGLGAIVGYLAGRPRKRPNKHEDLEDNEDKVTHPIDNKENSKLSDEDRDYIN
jgi:hypothetical protein